MHLSIGGGNAAPPPRPMFMAKEVASVARDETQINPGQQTITMSVTGSWRFVPKP